MNNHLNVSWLDANYTGYYVVKIYVQKQFSMAIYNRWGQMIFETSDTKGWDGKDEPAGVYNWVISYADAVGKVYKLRGSVVGIK